MDLKISSTLLEEVNTIGKEATEKTKKITHKGQTTIITIEIITINTM
jgi:hypothetical protein